MAIKNAPPDGYLLMMGHTGTHAINATLYTDLKFDPVKDFRRSPALDLVQQHSDCPGGEPGEIVAELVAYAKTKPEGLSYGSQGVGTGGHLLGVLFAKQRGVNLVHVPYRGIAPAVTDTVAGRMDMLFASYLSSGAQSSAASCGMLAIAGAQRHPRIPDLPTMAEAGYPEVQMQQWFGLFAPAEDAGGDRAEAQRGVRQGAAKRRGARQGAAAGRLRACRPRRTSLARWSRATSSGSARW